MRTTAIPGAVGAAATERARRNPLDDLVAPLFVKAGIDDPEPVGSMPGVMQHTQESLRKEVRTLAGLGVPGVISAWFAATQLRVRPNNPTATSPLENHCCYIAPNSSINRTSIRSPASTWPSLML